MQVLPLPRVLLRVILQYLANAYVPSPDEAARVRKEKRAWSELDKLRQEIFDEVTGSRSLMVMESIEPEPYSVYELDISEFRIDVVDEVCDELEHVGWKKPEVCYSKYTNVLKLYIQSPT